MCFYRPSSIGIAPQEPAVFVQGVSGLFDQGPGSIQGLSDAGNVGHGSNVFLEADFKLRRRSLILRMKRPLGYGHLHAGRIPFGKKDAEKGLEFRECTRCCRPEGVVRMGAVPAQRPVGVQGQAVACPAAKGNAEAERQFVPCGPEPWL